MIFDWDSQKDDSNLIKHGISFDEASSAFFDEHQVIIIDNRKDYGETREILIGKTKDLLLIIIIYVHRNKLIRIISARVASVKETQLYYGYRS